MAIRGRVSKRSPSISAVVKELIPALESRMFLSNSEGASYRAGLFDGYLFALHQMTGYSVAEFAQEIIDQENRSSKVVFFRAASEAQKLLKESVLR